VEYDGRGVSYHVSEMDEMDPRVRGYIHKAQGSEYPAVIIPMSTQHYVLLRRNLLYHGHDPSRRLVIVIGSRQSAAKWRGKTASWSRALRIWLQIITPYSDAH